jgi:hypothetical protein
MTESLQLVSIEMSVRVVEPHPIALESDKVDPTEPPAYIPLLTPPPFVPPAPLDAQKGLPKNTRIALPTNIAKGKELEITPETLRFLGQAVQSYRGETRDIVSAANVVQGRLELQLKELSRQLGKLAEVERIVESDKKKAEGALGGRLEKAREKQRELLARLDRVLQRLMDSHQPVLSTYEKQWFEELARMEAQISKDKTGSGRTLQARLDQVRFLLFLSSGGPRLLKRTFLYIGMIRPRTRYRSYDLSCGHSRRRLPRRRRQNRDTVRNLRRSRGNWVGAKSKGCKAGLRTSAFFSLSLLFCFQCFF